MKKQVFACALTLALAGGILAGCSSDEGSSSSQASSASSSASSAASTETTDTAEITEVEMSYISPADVETQLDNEDYLILDVRKAEDYEAGHIPGAINADMDLAKDGDYESGIESMTAALEEATGTDNGDGKNLVLVCYSGKRYAQAATNVLNYLEADMDKVVTLEGGMQAWTGETEA